MQRVLFLDDGGVMNDNRRRGPQWQRHVADFLAPRLGGTKRAWRQANAIVAERQFRDMPLPELGADEHAFWAFHNGYLETWLVGMCEEVGLASPDSQSGRVDLAREANDYVTRRTHAAFRGAIPAIRTLRRQGYTLHTASGEFSIDLEGYLTAMGVRDCFGKLYGCDLLGVAKAGPGYYERLFRDVGVDPTQALVVDDNERALGWAATVGVQTVLCGETVPTNGKHWHIGRLAELPALLRDRSDESTRI